MLPSERSWTAPGLRKGEWPKLARDPMWNWFNCYLSGRHEYGVWCEPGAIFLRCVHCGKRSSGWEVAARPGSVSPPPQATVKPTHPTRVLPFERTAS